MDRGAWWAYGPWDHKELDTTEQPFAKEIVGTVCKLKPPSQQKPRIEMGLYK